MHIAGPDVPSAQRCFSFYPLGWLDASLIRVPLRALQHPELSTEEARGVLGVLFILRQGLTL